MRPLWDNLIRFAPGPDLDEGEEPWVVDEGRPPQHQFKGYTLDEKMRPRFRYEFAEIRVEDYSVDLPGASEGGAFLRRTVMLNSESERSGLTFRAATGKKIERTEDGSGFLVDDRLQIRIAGERAATIVDGEEFKQIQIPLNINAGETSLILEYRW